MKKRKVVIFILVAVAVIIAGVGIAAIILNQPSELELKIRQLDKAYSNLDKLELEAPFDTERLDDYFIRSLSTPEHIGIDFFAKEDVDSIPFLAMQDGIVTRVEFHIMENQEGSDNWAVMIETAINTKYSILLNIETFGPGNEIKERQQGNIFVKEGDFIKKGANIGNLIVGGRGAHVHFGLKREDAPPEKWWVVPEPYFSDNAFALINTVLIQ